MSSNTNEGACRTNSWLAGIVIGVLAFLLAWKGLDWSFVWSVIVGIIVFFITGYLIIRFLCTDIASENTSSAPTASPAPVSAPEPKPAPAPAPAAKKTEKAKPAPKAAPAPKAIPVSEGGTKPAMLDAARGGNADDLKKIKGVGPGLEKLLNSLGVFHFDQIAGWSANEVAWVDDNMLKFKGRATRDGWVDQAKKLASGEDTDFSKKVDKGDVY